MKSMILGGVAALTLGVTGAMAQNANPTPSPAATPAQTTANASATAGANGEFITTQQPGELRAPKLIGVAVYDNNNKDIGKITDLLLDKDGQIKAVVLGIGGFLGIGQKNVAVPYSAIHWQTEQRTVAVGNAAPANSNNTLGGTAPGAANGGTAGTAANGNAAAGAANNGQPAQKTVSPEKQEAYQGYPDRAVIDMSQQQLKNAPDFKYASQTMNSDGTTKSTK